MRIEARLSPRPEKAPSALSRSLFDPMMRKAGYARSSQFQSRDRVAPPALGSANATALTQPLPIEWPDNWPQPRAFLRSATS
jgi:hypothetical protein